MSINSVYADEITYVHVGSLIEPSTGQVLKNQLVRIENSDLDSKATFVLVTRIIDLNSSSLDKLVSGPVLTLPAR